MTTLSTTMTEETIAVDSHNPTNEENIHGELFYDNEEEEEEEKNEEDASEGDYDEDDDYDQYVVH